MLEQDSIRNIANKAEIIVNGYAFSKNNNELSFKNIQFLEDSNA